MGFHNPPPHLSYHLYLWRFNIKNLNKQTRLYQQGLTPITKTVPGRGVWERLRNRVDYEVSFGLHIQDVADSCFNCYLQVVEEGLRVTFQISISDNRRLTTYFAFCYPYSYTKCQQRLARLDEQFKTAITGPSESPDDIYFYRSVHQSCSIGWLCDLWWMCRELVCHSLEGRRVDLITVTSCEGISEEREPRLPYLFPQPAAQRCHIFRSKKVLMCILFNT